LLSLPASSVHGRSDSVFAFSAEIKLLTVRRAKLVKCKIVSEILTSF